MRMSIRGKRRIGKAHTLRKNLYASHKHSFTVFHCISLYIVCKLCDCISLFAYSTYRYSLTYIDMIMLRFLIHFLVKESSDFITPIFSIKKVERSVVVSLPPISQLLVLLL